jgi:hypothetical protein
MSSHARQQPLFRSSRAVVFATVCVTLATVGHAFSSTAPVPAWAILTGFGLVLAVALLLTGHERSLATILGGLLGGQFVLHSLYAAATGWALPTVDAASPATAPAASAAAHHAATIEVGGQDSGISMTLAHVVAALVSAWWLRRGERAAWALARRIADMAERPIRAILAFLGGLEPSAPPSRTVQVPAVGETSTVGLILRHHVVRRGPPPRSRALAHA